MKPRTCQIWFSFEIAWKSHSQDHCKSQIWPINLKYINYFRNNVFLSWHEACVCWKTQIHVQKGHQIKKTKRTMHSSSLHEEGIISNCSWYFHIFITCSFYIDYYILYNWSFSFNLLLSIYVYVLFVWGNMHMSTLSSELEESFRSFKLALYAVVSLLT